MPRLSLYKVGESTECWEKIAINKVGLAPYRVDSIDRNIFALKCLISSMIWSLWDFAAILFANHGYHGYSRCCLLTMITMVIADVVC